MRPVDTRITQSRQDCASAKAAIGDARTAVADLIDQMPEHTTAGQYLRKARHGYTVALLALDSAETALAAAERWLA